MLQLITQKPSFNLIFIKITGLFILNKKKTPEKNLCTLKGFIFFSEKKNFQVYDKYI